MLRSEDFQVVPLPLKLGDRLPLGKGLRHWLAVHLGQFRLVIECLQVRGSTGHAQVNDALCLCGVVGFLDNPGPFLRVHGSGIKFIVQQ